MMKTAIFGLLLSFAASSEAASYFDTGNAIFSACGNEGQVAQAMCLLTPSAYLDMMDAAGYRCVTGGVDRNQARDVFIRYLRDHPAERNRPAADLAVKAFKQVFNCRLSR